MQDKKVKISNILGSIVPEFIHVDNPLFKDFLKQYYSFEEHDYGTTNLADNLAEYKNISTLAEIETVRAQTINLPTTGTPESPIFVTTPVFAYDQKIYTIHNDGFPLTYGLLKIDDEIITYTGKNSNKVATQIYARHPVGQRKRDPVLVGTGTDNNPQYPNAFIVDETLKRTTILLDTEVVAGLAAPNTPAQNAINNFAKIEAGMSFTATWKDDKGDDISVFPKGTFILAVDATTGSIVVSNVPNTVEDDRNINYAPTHTITYSGAGTNPPPAVIPIGVLFNIIDNSFTGCARGFSGISEIETQGNPEELTFSETSAAAHNLLSGVVNLNFIFLGQFYKKFKKNFLPGVENRAFAAGLSIENILTRAKDFFVSKGTDQSLDILFKVLFGKQITVNKPWDNTISASDANWLSSDEIIVDVIDGNPMKLKFSTLYQGESSDFLTNSTASGAIENVEEIFLDDKTYYKLFLSKETVKNKFNINNRTKIVVKSDDLSVVTVDSTIGFGITGSFWYPDIDGVYQKAEYTSKSYNQFFGCVGVTTAKENQSIVGGNFVYAYEDNDNTKICKMRIVGSISGSSEEIEHTKYSKVDDTITVKHLGQKSLSSDKKFNNWIYNNISETDILSIDTSAKNIETKDFHYLVKGDKIDIFDRYTNQLLDSNVTVDSITNEVKFNYTGNGTNSVLVNPPLVGYEYVIRKRINYVSNNLGTGVLLANIQNTFSDKENNTYVAFSGYPSQSLQTTNRSKEFSTTGISSGTYLSPGSIEITDHGFLNGEKVYYEPLSSLSGIKLGYINADGEVINSGAIGIETGTYYVSKIDDNNIRLAVSRDNIFTSSTLWDNPINYPIGIHTLSDTHRITPYSLWERGSLKNQNNFKRILKNPLRVTKDNERIVGTVGVTLNGIELNSPVSEDSVYYGQIDQSQVLNGGKNYDVINPPNVSVADTSGSGFNMNLHLSDGYVDEIILTSGGYDYNKTPAVTVSGGNGKGVIAEARMKDRIHSVAFSDGLVSIATTIGTIALDSEHRFLDGEEVIYTVSDDGHAIGVGITYTTVETPVAGSGSTSSLVNGGIYYISKNSDTNISLAVTKQRALDKQFLLDFTDDGSGTHKLEATRLRRVVDRIVLRTNGEGFSNNRVEINAQPYPPIIRSGIMTTFVGINTSDHYIFAKNHNYKSGEIVKYTKSTTAIGGLVDATNYYVTVVDKDKFKISTNENSYLNKDYINLTNIGVGTHTFNYPDIEVSIEGATATGIGLTAGGSLPNYYNASAYPVVRGKISNAFINNGGVGYGVSTILNHIRPPLLKIQTGENAVIGCIVDNNGTISNAYILDAGLEYTSPPILEVISTDKGKFGKLRANVSDGKIVSVDVINGGNSYTQLTTSVKVIPSGIDGNISADVHEWKVNEVERYSNILDNSNYKETIQVPSNVKSKGNKIVSFYLSKDLRQILEDNIRGNNDEAVADDRKHSPIIGWAYDGNPIYGPYGNAFGVPDVNGNRGGIKRIESSYELNVLGDDNLRPNYVNGFFIDDYEYDEDSGDLDEFNGRFITNDDFPEGTYAYFSTIDKDTGSSKSVYPYVTLKHFNETDSFNYSLLIDQLDETINDGSYRRNVTHLGLNDLHRRYPFLSDPLNSGSSLTIESVKSAGLTTIFVDNSGINYGVGNTVTFADPSTVTGKVNKVFGKSIVSIASSTIQENNLTFKVENNLVTAISTSPHNYLDSDIIQISGITSSLYSSIEGKKTIGVTTITTTNSVAIGNTSVTGISTFIQLKEPSWTEKIEVNDVIQIGDERMLVLNKDNYNNRYRVSRMHQGTSGSAHNVGLIVRKLPQEFTFSIKNTANRDVFLPNRYNFEGPSLPNQTTNLDGSIGIGSTAQSRLVGYAGTTNPVYKTIPARSIYLPNHEFKTGEKLKYVSIGSTLKYSITDALTPQLDITGINTFFCIKWNRDFIGISTQNIGFGTELNSGSIGITSTAVWFTTDTEGKDHRFETITNNLTGKADKIVGTILLDTDHDLDVGDTIDLNVSPNLIQTYDFRFDSEIKKLVVDPLEFASSGVSTGTDSTITVPSHNLNTGDIVYYKASSAIGGLVSKTRYHVIRISDDVIRLAKTKVLLNKTPAENITFNNVGSGNHELLRINPKLKVYRGNVVSIGVSNPSMSDYDVDFYYDKEFKSRLESETIRKNGVFGDSATTTNIIINTDDSLPSTIFYKIKGKSNNYINTLESVDTEVVDHSSIHIFDSEFNGSYPIAGIGSTTIELNMVGFAETTNYPSTGINSAFYITKSLTAKGGIHSIEVNQLKPTENLIKIVGTGSTGSDALFSEESDDIGQIIGTKIDIQGFEYPADKTLTPAAEIYTVLKLKDVYTIDSIGISSGGRNYTSAPSVIAIGNSSITTKSKLNGNSVGEVEIVNNDSGLSKNIKFIPTFNSNGIGIIESTSNFAVNQLKLKAPVTGFSTFPFKVGEKIWVENVRITDNMDGYNSSDYDYRFFTISAINTTGGDESISYSIAGIGSTGGTFDLSNVFGRVISENEIASFTPNLNKVKFIEGEEVRQLNGKARGTVAKNGWDPVSQLLKLKNVKGVFEEDSKISSSLLDSKSSIQKIYNFDFDLIVDSIVNKSTTWDDDKGKLNDNTQRVHDNDYYQRFSYAIQGEVPFDSWKEPVTSLGHISGYKPFGDLEILNGDGSSAGMGTFFGDVSLDIEVTSNAAVYERYYYDYVTEDTNDPTYSKIIVFDGKVLTDYSESRTNKVLLIDDIASQFTGKTKTFTGIHTFISAGTNSVSVISGGSGSLTPTGGTDYDASTGILTIVTSSPHGLSNGATVSISDNSLIFRCNIDNYATDHSYPRSTDPASTSNTRFNNGILSIGNTTANSFTVTVNTPVIGGQNVGLSTFKLYTIDEKGVKPTGISTERLFLKTIQPSIGIGLTDSEFTINDNEFNTGEPLIYSSNGFTRIGIDTTIISGVSTNFLPEEVYAIVAVTEGIREKDKFKLASSASNANSGIALTITSVGTGNTHTFAVPTELATNRTLITIDNVIQSPLTFKKDISIGLSTAVGIGSTQIFLQDISEMYAGIVKIENELIKVQNVGVGSTNSLNVVRGVMGSVSAAHTVGAAITVVSGDYRIKNGTIHFTSPPYGLSGIGSLAIRSSFSGRSFYRLKYDKNFIFDDLSEQFDSQSKDFYITSNGNEISGITTNYGFVLVNNIWQDPHHGEGGSNLNTSDYQIIGSGTSITFAGTYANNVYVGSATKDLPQGGIINEFDVNPGVGIQSAFTAIGIASVGVGGTIASVSIGNSGSGYLYPPRVSVAITNYHYDHTFVSAATNSITSAGSTNYTPSYAEYTSRTGDLVLTINNHGLGTNDTVLISNNTIVFKCSKDGYSTEHSYPRTTDPVSGIQTSITNATTNTITVNVGSGAGIGASLTASVENGMITGISVINPGAGYTTSYQPIITIDPPSPWKNLPLTGGQGSGATLDVVVGTAGSAIEYELANPGIGYSTGDILSLDPVPYKVGVSTTPLTLTVKNRHQDKFAGWTVGQLLEMDSFSSLFNGFRKQFLITRTVGGIKGYFSIIAKKDSGVVLANNLLVYINDVLQKPVIDYNFDKGTRITFNDAPKRGSKIRMYLYVASRDDYFDVDIDETIKPGDTVRIQPNLPTAGESVPYDTSGISTARPLGDKLHPIIDPSYPSQEDRIVYELISSDSVETQTYGGPGIATNGLGNIERPVLWSKQQADSVIDGVPISKSRVYLEPEITPNTNIIAPVSATDTKIYVRNIYPTFYAYDDIGQNLNHVRIVGFGSTAIGITTDTDGNDSGVAIGTTTGETGILNVEEIRRVTYSGDHGVIIGINTGKTGVGTHQLIFDLHPAVNIQNEVSRTGLNTGDFFVIENSIIGSGVTALGITTSTIVGTGTTWIDGVYQVSDFTTTGVGASTLRVTCHVESLTGIDTTGLPAPISGATGRHGCGTYTWGTVNVSRSGNSKSFSYYNSNGLAGIETSAYVSRLLGLA